MRNVHLKQLQKLIMST